MADKKIVIIDNHVGVAESKVADKILFHHLSLAENVSWSLLFQRSECGNNGN